MTEAVLIPTLRQQIASYAEESTTNESNARLVTSIVTEFIRATKLSPLLDGEPIFVLRAQDKIAPYAVMCWASEAEAYGCTPSIVAGARTIAAEMCAWAMANPTRVKRPD